MRLAPATGNPYAHRARSCALVTLALLTLAVPAGCVRRRLAVRSNPPGAVVFVDNQQIGTTPCSVDFTYYGTREIRLVKPGYETLTVNQPIPTPWYQIPPIDFVSENVLPNKIEDHRTVAFNLNRRSSCRPNNCWSALTSCGRKRWRVPPRCRRRRSWCPDQERHPWLRRQTRSVRLRRSLPHPLHSRCHCRPSTDRQSTSNRLRSNHLASRRCPRRIQPEPAADDLRAEHHSTQLTAAHDEPIDNTPGHATERHPHRICSLLSAGAADDNADDAVRWYAARPADYQPAATVGMCRSPTRSQSARFILFRAGEWRTKRLALGDFLHSVAGIFASLIASRLEIEVWTFVGKMRTRLLATKWIHFVC